MYVERVDNVDTAVSSYGAWASAAYFIDRFIMMSAFQDNLLSEQAVLSDTKFPSMHFGLSGKQTPSAHLPLSSAPTSPLATIHNLCMEPFLIMTSDSF